MGHFGFGFMEPAAGAAAYVANNGADFDGTSDWLEATSMTGISDSKTFIFSCWVYPDALSYYQRVFGCEDASAAVDGIRIQIGGDGEIVILGLTSVPSIELNYFGASSQIGTAAWQHILIAVDMTDESGCFVYVDDSDVTGSWNEVTDATLDFTKNRYTVGGDEDGGEKFNGGLQEVYFAADQYIDISVEANRRKFIDASGKPVDLGSDGSTPTGTSPDLYLKSAYDSFETNSGSGSNFTVNGALADKGSSPSD